MPRLTSLVYRDGATPGGQHSRLNEIIGNKLSLKPANTNPLEWVQANYSRLLTESGTGVAAYMADLCWELLPEKDRASNRRAADHAWIKLRTLGWQTIDRQAPAGVEIATYLDHCRQQLQPPLAGLAELEHRRWCAEKILEGYTALLDEVPGPRDAVQQMEWKGDKKEKWRQQKRHLDLDLFDNLSGVEQQKEYDQIPGLPYLLLAIGLRLTTGAGPGKPV